MAAKPKMVLKSSAFTKATNIIKQIEKYQSQVATVDGLIMARRAAGQEAFTTVKVPIDTRPGKPVQHVEVPLDLHIVVQQIEARRTAAIEKLSEMGIEYDG